MKSDGEHNPWNEDLKPASDSHIQPMELPTLPNDDRCLVYPHTTSLFIHLPCRPIPCAYGMDDHINVPHPQLCQMMTGMMMPSMTSLSFMYIGIISLHGNELFFDSFCF